MTIQQDDGVEAAEVPEGDGSFDRRSFLKTGLGVAGFAAATAVLGACTSDDGDTAASTTQGGGESDAPATSVALTQDGPEIVWEMATSWPVALVTLFGSAQFFANEVSRLTGGKFQINPRPAGEIVGGLEVLPTVRDVGVQSGHTASYYYVGLSPVQQFGTAVPFGLTQRQQNAWLYKGGGSQLLNEFYAEEHGIIAFPAGGTGCQMGGWFTKELNTVADLQGLKMRIPGLAGRVLQNLGGEQVTLPGGEILPAIQQGAIDGAEFVGPTDDLILGLDQFDGDLFYYHPGWWEPGTAVEVQFPLSLWNDLPCGVSGGNRDRCSVGEHQHDRGLRRAQPSRPAAGEGVRIHSRIPRRAHGCVQGRDGDRARQRGGRGCSVCRHLGAVAKVPRRHLRVAQPGRALVLDPAVPDLVPVDTSQRPGLSRPDGAPTSTSLRQRGA